MCDAKCIPFSGRSVIECDKGDHDLDEDPIHSAVLPNEIDPEESDRISWREDDPRTFR